MLYLQSGANLQSPDAVLAKCRPLATERVRVEWVPPAAQRRSNTVEGIGSVPDQKWGCNRTAGSSECWKIDKENLATDERRETVEKDSQVH